MKNKKLTKEQKALAEETSRRCSAKKRYLYAAGAAQSIASIFIREPMDGQTLFDGLSKQLELVEKGDTSVIDYMLLTQAQTLQALFNYVAEKISLSGSLEELQAYGELAAKFNNNSRKTLLALHTIKHPPANVIVNQQNNAINQQINEGGRLKAKALKNISANELLSIEEKDETLDPRRESAAISADTEVAALEVSRSKNQERQRNKQNERLKARGEEFRNHKAKAINH
jgi:hypothetical protein